ncbi:MAG TPA: hypothetical protein VLE43_21525, partial [Candidatus Saccharimonadia bacterium]|nr:hypothetical protein [Candidatus Saccharimonadia bacterium]
PFMLMIVLVPWTHRGVPFRVEPGDVLEVRRDGRWQILNVHEFPLVVANALNIGFYANADDDKPVLQLPLSRVYSCELGTRVKAPVIAEYFRLRLEKAGYAVKPRQGRPTMHENWVAQRGAGSEDAAVLLRQAMDVGWIQGKDDLSELLAQLEQGRDYGVQDAAFEHIAGMLRVSFRDEYVTCEPHQMIEHLRKLIAALPS